MKKYFLFLFLFISFLNPIEVHNYKFNIASVESDIYKHIIRYQSKLTSSEIKTLIKALEIGYKTYGINYKIVVNIIAIESNYHRYAINNNYGNRITYDYGLCQVNSDYWDNLSKISRDILDNKNINYSNDKYDIMLNVMNCYLVLYQNKNTLNNRGMNNEIKIVQSYNCGVNGSLINNIFWKERRSKYFNNYMNAVAYLEAQ